MFYGLSKQPWEFTEEDLQELENLQIPEGLHIDYKSSSLLENKDNAINNLTKEVSAFNNADGGAIVIGIEESTEGGQPRPARIDDGVDGSRYTVTWLTQIIQDNISPTIPELRINAVLLNSRSEGQTAFVLWIPRGKRAVQARDCKYYQRREDQSVPMRDFQVRDVNNRMDGPDLRFELALPTDRRLTHFSADQNKLDVSLSVRNWSDALPEYATFRFVVPQSLVSERVSYNWSQESWRPEIILLSGEGQQLRQDTAIVLRKLYQLPNDQPIFPGAGPVVLGTISLIFRSAYQAIPHLEPVVLMVASPGMETRVEAFVLSTDGLIIESAEIDEQVYGVILDGKDPLTFFREI